MNDAGSEPIRLLIADDHAIVRTGLRAVLRRHRDIVLVGEATTTAEMLDCAAALRPDVIVADLKMPGGDTMEAIRAIREGSDGATRVVVFTGFDSRMDAWLAFRAGASAYVVKGSDSDSILLAVREVHRGGRYIDPVLGEEMVTQLSDEDSSPDLRGEALSSREAQVVEMMAMGHTNKEIAMSLGIGVKSVETYRYRATDKLGFKSRAELTYYARQSGVLHLQAVKRSKG